MISVPILLRWRSSSASPGALGVIVVLNLMIGLLTPPVGGICYVISSVTGVSVTEVFRGVIPFLVPLLAVLLLVTFAPALVLWLPGVMNL